MKVAFDNNQYKVSWQHNSGELFTRCKIYNNDLFQPLALGTAYCSEHDNFDRNKGRKLSLSRALDELFGQDRETRKLFWNEYYKMRNGKW